jgi:AcrR family transcriptional regulator
MDRHLPEPPSRAGPLPPLPLACTDTRACRRLRGTTAGGRAATRRAHLIDVGIELLGEKGPTGITVREVYARARLNPRYFYESFKDLDALMVAIFDELLSDTIGLVLEAIERAEESEPAKTRAAIETAFRYLTDDPRRIQILLSDALGSKALAMRRSELVRIGADLMAEQAAGFYGIPNDARLLRSTTYMLAGGLVELLIAWHNRTLDLDVEELIDDASALVSGMGDAARAVADQRRGNSTSRSSARRGSM